jgi:DNA-binding MarR family transcriptional regulator
MHAISFLLKRAHLCTTNHGQRILYDVPGMTPARFDILCFARQGGIRRRMHDFAFTTQRRIREGLGLSASTLSRMLKRLEELGWIQRERDYGDRRVNTVMLTKLGRRKAWKAMRVVFRGRFLAADYEHLARSLRPTEHVLDALDHLFDTLDLIAMGFGDESYFHYDYGSKHRLPFWRYLPFPSFRYFTPRDSTLGPRIVDPKEPYPTPYQKWVAPLRRDQEALLDERRAHDYCRV